MITVVGIGTDRDDMTLGGKAAVESAQRVFVRTAKTAAGKAVKGAQSMDDLFETCEDFDKLGETVVSRLLSADKECGSVAYCTDSDALCDAVTEKLLASGADVKIVRGVFGGVNRYGECRLLSTAYGILRMRPYLDTAAALEITEIDDRLLAGELKLYLLDFYPPDKNVAVRTGRETKETTLEEIDRLSKYTADTSLFISGSGALAKKRYCFGDLMRIMSRLTAPDGCPWDKAQTHESIRSNMIEEAYEAVDAIDSGDIDAMREEIGDVLLQAVFHCDMGARTGEFDFNDVVSELCGKLYFRHTHIFGSDKACNPDEALKYWENAKAVEKSYTDLYDILSRLPKGFPALLRAEKAVKKAVKAGREEGGAAITEEELSAALLELCRRAAASGVDAETALGKAVGDYIESFKK